MSSRTKKAKLNIFTSMAMQGVTMISGLILPQLFIRAYGSSVYGLTTSITHFLAYISLLEGGVSGVARAALYKPLADQEQTNITGVYTEIVRFFRIIASVFLVYTFLLAVGYKYIADEPKFDWIFTFVLVLVMSISTLAQYFFGISNSILVQADQKHYINNLISIFALLLNTVLVILLVNIGCDIILVKLISGCVYLIRPFALMLYVKKHYVLKSIKQSGKTKYLSQKWTALGQHIAYFLHTNTDVVVLTIFTNLQTVAVYSLYNMVVSSVRSLVLSFSSGMESVLGNMYAKNEKDGLYRTFENYETMLSIVLTIFFSITSALILPFIKIYTNGITDADYIQPVFAIILVLAEMVYCIRLPYHYMINAAARFKQTKFAAYGEAAINIVGSILLVNILGLVGVAIATLVATAYRTVYYVWYLSKHILHRKISKFIKRQSLNAIIFCIIALVGIRFSSAVQLANYLTWCVFACVLAFVAFILVMLANCVFYKNSCKAVIAKVIRW